MLPIQGIVPLIAVVYKYKKVSLFIRAISEGIDDETLVFARYRCQTLFGSVEGMEALNRLSLSEKLVRSVSLESSDGTEPENLLLLNCTDMSPFFAR